MFYVLMPVQFVLVPGMHFVEEPTSTEAKKLASTVPSIGTLANFSIGGRGWRTNMYTQ